MQDWTGVEVDSWTAESLLELEEGEDERDQDKEEEGEVEAAELVSGRSGTADGAAGYAGRRLLLTGEELGEEAREAEHGVSYDYTRLEGLIRHCVSHGRGGGLSPITREPEEMMRPTSYGYRLD